jgi:hypothetical protein
VYAKFYFNIFCNFQLYFFSIFEKLDVRTKVLKVHVASWPFFPVPESFLLLSFCQLLLALALILSSLDPYPTRIPKTLTCADGSRHTPDPLQDAFPLLIASSTTSPTTRRCQHELVMATQQPHVLVGQG